MSFDLSKLVRCRIMSDVSIECFESNASPLRSSVGRRSMLKKYAVYSSDGQPCFQFIGITDVIVSEMPPMRIN